MLITEVEEANLKRPDSEGFSDGSAVKNPPGNAGDTGLTPGQGAEIPHAVGQLSR